MSDKPHVAVVGGGLAGLTAGFELAARGARVTLFEAATEVGGRSRTDDVDGFGVDVGTQLVGSMYRRFRDLVGRLEMDGGLIPSSGRDALWRKGRAHEVVYGSVGSMIASGGLPITTKMRLGAIYVPFLARNASALDLLHPEFAAKAGLDSESIATWGEREIDAAFVRSLVYPQLGAYYGSHPEETSAGFYHILARYGMDVSLFAVQGGVGRVALALADRIRALGGSIHCETPVTSIRPGTAESGAWITTDSDLHFDAAVSALPAPILSDILVEAPVAMSEWLAPIRYRPCVTAAFLLDRPTDVDYFGLSFPRGESRNVAAICVEENKPGSVVPEGKGLLVAIATPEMAPTLSQLDSQSVIDQMMPDLQTAFPAISGSIERARVYRWPVGAPVYFPGYLGHLGAFGDGAVEEDSGLALCGDYLISSSVEGAVVSGMNAARRTARRVGLPD